MKRRGDDLVSPGQGPEGSSPRSALVRSLREWGVLLGLALGVAFLLRTFLVQPFGIPSASMVPTLEIGDKVLVNKLSYRLHDVNRGDVVVFETPPGMERAGVNDLIKRVVGLPGETVEGKGGHVFVDGRTLEEPYLPQGVTSKTFPPHKVPDGEFWVLGDNRQNSQDSTYFGTIDGDTIVGRAFLRWWPVGRIGLL